MLREPFRSVVDADTGTLRGKTGRYEKRLSALTDLYRDGAAHAALVEALGDPIVYEVDEYRPGADHGDLTYGVTRMSPGRISGEYFITRGHIHALADRPEIYFGQRGRGLMQLESPEGETRIVEIGPQTICYVPPYWIHRAVNVGAEDLVMFFAYPADSGQDYAIIESSKGMHHRVFATPDGGWELRENDAYVPRSAARIAELMDHLRQGGKA